MKDYLNEFLPDLQEFKEKTMQFHNGEMKVAEYKSFSGAYGSYAQRGGLKHMLRLRMAGGDLDLQKIKFIVDEIDKYNIKTIKLTTCQCIQFHNLEAEDLIEMIGDVWKHGMLTRGGGGDFPRNVMASSLSGVEVGENFDVLPYAKETGNFLMHYIKGKKFPRKLKVGFSNSTENESHATIRDLGFVSTKEGKFDVYCCGGMGNNPKLGVKVANGVDPSKILYYVDAMVRTFIENGNYENRAKARTRYMQDTLGVDGVKEAFNRNLCLSLNGPDLTISLSNEVISKTGNGEIENSRCIAQKQKGLYSVFYQPLGGMVNPDTFKNLYNTISSMEDVHIRVTPEESFYVINLTAEEAQKVLDVTPDCATTPLEKSVACVGCTICQVGVGDSQGLLHLIVSKVKEANIKATSLPSIHISGCPSSCSGHPIAKIGFRGSVKQSSTGVKPAFAVSYGGCAIEGKEYLAPMNAKNTIYVEQIPDFLIEIAHMVESCNTDYDTWIFSHKDDMDSLITKYSEIKL